MVIKKEMAVYLNNIKKIANPSKNEKKEGRKQWISTQNKICYLTRKKDRLPRNYKERLPAWKK